MERCSDPGYTCYLELNSWGKMRNNLRKAATSQALSPVAGGVRDQGPTAPMESPFQASIR